MTGTNVAKKKILILAAFSAQSDLDLGKEIEEIEEIMQGGSKSFDVDQRTAKTVDKVRQAIRYESPQIVHFCGHGLEDGSFLLDDENDKTKKHPLEPKGLAGFFSNLTDVECVILNACYSVKAADLIAENIAYVIGMNRAIGDDAAIKFVRGFYEALRDEALGNRPDVFDKAFERGLQALGGHDPSQQDIPVIRKNLTVQKPEVRLISPAEHSTVPMRSTFSGTYKHLEEDMSLWLFIFAPGEGKYYLDEIVNYRNGNWEVSGVIIGGEADNRATYEVGVLIADAEATRTLRIGSDGLKELPSGVKKFSDYSIYRE